MSYYMQQIEGTFVIPHEHVEEAINAIVALYDRLGYSARGNTSDRVAGIEDAFELFGWSAYTSANGNVFGIDSNRSGSDDDDMLLDAVAPYVVPGSYLLMCGEDGYLWAWYFDGKTCVSATVFTSIIVNDKEIRLPPTIG